MQAIAATLRKRFTSASEERATLSKLCQLLSNITENSVYEGTVDDLSPPLVKLAAQTEQPDIALLAIQAMTYLCTACAEARMYLVRDGAVSVLCNRLMGVPDMNIAEQCLEALDKISQELPHACCRAGAATAALKKFEFFSESLQTLALTVVMNISREIPSDLAPLLMDSVPILVKLLFQHDDQQSITELATLSLIGISLGITKYPARLPELCEHGFIPATFYALVSSDLPERTSKVLLRAYGKISRRSFEVYQTLLELDFAGVIKDNVSASSDRCCATLELINVLLSCDSKQDRQLKSKKQKFLHSRKGLVENLGRDVVRLLVHADAMGSYISHACLRIVEKLICLCSSEFLVDLFKSVNISRFLADALSGQDLHVHLLALQLSEWILESQSTEFLQSFIKEGVFYFMDKLPEHSVPIRAGQGPCLCFPFHKSSSEGCMLEKVALKYLVNHMRSIYFPDSDRTTSAVFRQLRDFSAQISDTLKEVDAPDHQLRGSLDEIFSTINSREPISTFEFIHSGMVKSLAQYLHHCNALPPEKKKSRVRVLKRICVSPDTISTLVKELEKELNALDASLYLKTCSSDILQVLCYLYRCNCIYDQIYDDRIQDFAKGDLQDLESLKVSAHSVPQIEFVSAKLTKSIEEGMRNYIPAWCKLLMASYAFLFGFGARRKFFQMDAFGALEPRYFPQNFTVSRDRILEVASQLMDLLSKDVRVSVNLKFKGEIGGGSGPTREFYTLLSHELQDAGTGMWREDSSGLFPRPLNDAKLDTQVRHNFILLGRTVARAIREGRILDLQLSKAFYKLILGKELGVFDIPTFDPALGRTLIEFTALVRRKEYSESEGRECETLYRGMRIEDLCLDFTLPGYPDYVLGSGLEEEAVTMQNFKEYVSRVLDATIGSGISNQVEWFRYGFNQLFPIEKLAVFTEEELEQMLCGENERWSMDELLNHLIFDHGYTATSPPMGNLLEIMAEFDASERRAFLQFATGSPRLPIGGFGSLNPKLTIVRKESIEELPSVMTCVNYLKVPPYASKQLMRQKLIYAITDGQHSFEFS